MRPFDEVPEFIELDNRRLRGISPVSIEQMHNKHAVLLPASIIEGKSILDLGCCLGATGHWCLSLGASRYVGVEVQESYATLARTLLDSHHPGKALVEHTSIEAWLAKEHERFDVVVMLGILYVFVDYYSILKSICDTAEEIVAIEGLYPDLRKFGSDFCGVEFWSRQRINLADEEASLTGRGARLSPRGLQFLLQGFGFESKEGILFPEPIKGSKDLFNAPEEAHNARFLVRFFRTDRKVPSLSEDLQEGRRGEKLSW